MEERYKDVDEEDNDMDDDMEDVDYPAHEVLMDKANLPSVNDPRLW